MRRRYIVTILTALGVVGYLAVDDKELAPDNASIEVISQEPDYIIKGVVAQFYDKNGQLDRQINALSARHFPANDSTELITPTMVIRKGLEAHWSIKSKQGVLSKGETLDLNGDVSITPLKDSQADFSLSTQHLSMDLNKQIADTAEPVLIESPSTRLNAKGMNMNLKTQQVQFKSQVRGQHDPKAQ